MRRILFASGLSLVLFSTLAQENNVGAKLEELTLKWDNEAEGLSSYDGLTKFCLDANHRGEMTGTLKGIHHYDSVLYETIAQKARFGGTSEMKKTMKDIEKLEDGYSIKAFLVFLQEECNARRAIEKNARKTGEDKDAEVYVLETELSKYVKRITKRIDVVREHVRHLSVK
ncbi:MAG: hypothetical protein GY816_16055 [Cytophagales bacterium]|nr:hypothetical protein [Cytophagales bacterium]